MSRHNGSSGGRGLPLFQLEVLDFANRDNDHVPTRTLVGRFKNHEAADRWGRRFGTIKECRKVDTSPYLKNIEHLNLKQQPITIKVDREEYILTKALELRRPRRDISDRKFDIEIIDKEQGLVI